MAIWKSTYSIGVPAIDAQHQELFTRADSLLLAMTQRRTRAECAALLVFLRAYCRVHFAAEERLMEEMGYPGTVGHLAQHAEFNRRFETIAAEFSTNGASALLVIKLQNLIGGWLVKHIGAQDTQLAAFVADERGSSTF